MSYVETVRPSERRDSLGTAIPGAGGLVQLTETHVFALLGGEPTGHDWHHADRVRLLALRLAREEGADPLVVELAALLHDVEDYKFSGDEEAGPKHARHWLSTQGAPTKLSESVASIIEQISFKGAGVADASVTLEGQCVQDADRLDAIGAIGIARVFAYGATVGRPIHDPKVPAVHHDSAEAYRAHQGTSINHFHEKLLLVRERMHTRTGMRIAAERHEVLLDFLARFDDEWRGRA